MKESFQKTLSGLSSVFKYVLIAAVIAFISTLFPNNAKFKYRYVQGQVWKYEDLIAPIDFPLLKSETQIDIEKLSIVKDLRPYYQRNKSVLVDQISAFQRDFQTFSNTLSDASGQALTPTALDGIKQFLRKELENYYNTGIIELSPDHKEFNSNYLINVIEENTSKVLKIGSFSDLASAYADLNAKLESNFTGISQPLLVFVSKYLRPNINYNQDLNDKFLSEKFNGISLTQGKVTKGDILIANGSIITDEAFIKLKSYQLAYEDEVSSGKSFWGVFLGYLLLTCLIVGALLMYLRFHFPVVFDKLNNLAFILFWLVLFSFLVSKIEDTVNLSSYLIPFSIVPIIIKNFFKERLALFVHIVIVLIASFLSDLGYEFTFLQILVGIVTVLVVTETRYWNKFFMAIVIIFVTYVLGYVGLSMIKEGSINDISFNTLGWLGLNSFLLLLAYPLIPLCEKIFGFTSSITLAELGDMNRPLLKDLSIKAPGTLQHSLQVANLSEAAADKIGANSLLVKVAALYHDIGKMKDPVFFIENQSGSNPHDGLTNFESAEKIIAHVTEGEKMAKKAKLPQIIIDFINNHHGTTRVEYFYRNQKNQFPDKEFDESLFRYPGPKPVSKEATIMMMADSLEASSKALKNPTGKDIDELVDKIIVGKLEQGQLDDSELSFDELEKCKSVFKSLLRSINHVRIEYPKEQTPEVKENKGG
jgi:putative nucleotidyltransferase with HDIG domain